MLSNSIRGLASKIHSNLKLIPVGNMKCKIIRNINSADNLINKDEQNRRTNRTGWRLNMEKGYWSWRVETIHSRDGSNPLEERGTKAQATKFDGVLSQLLSSNFQIVEIGAHQSGYVFLIIRPHCQVTLHLPHHSLCSAFASASDC